MPRFRWHSPPPSTIHNRHAGRAVAAACIRDAVINTFVRVLLALACAVLLGVAAGFALMMFAPSRWFGSSFEGACGYGALFAAIGLGLLVALVSFGVLLWRGFRIQLSAVEPFTSPPSKLVNAWIALLALQYVVPLLHWVFGIGFGMLDGLAQGLLLVAFIAASWALLRYRGMHPALSLLAVVPLVGVPVVGVLLWKPARAAFGGYST